MAKLVGMFKRKSGTSPEEFRAYYEGNHASFALSHFGHLYESYTRNYIDPTVLGDDSYDVVTEIVFKEPTGAADMFALTTPELSAAIAADEAVFMDRSVTKLFIIDDHQSSEL